MRHPRSRPARSTSKAANFGTIQHELLVFKSDLAAIWLPIDQDGNIIEDGPGITLVSDGDNFDPGTTQARTVDLTQPGTYLFVCNIPGHFKAGMFSASHGNAVAAGCGPGRSEGSAAQQVVGDWAHATATGKGQLALVSEPTRGATSNLRAWRVCRA